MIFQNIRLLRKFVSIFLFVFNRKAQTLKLLLSLFFLLLFIVPGSAQDFTYKEKKEIPNYPEYISQAGWSPFRNYFAVCVGNNTLEIYDKNWKKILTHQGNPKSVGGRFAFSPDEKYLAYGRYKSNNDVAIFRLSDLKVIQVLQGHTDFVNKLSFSNNGKYLASCSGDNTTRLYQWDGDELAPFQVFTEHTDKVNGISFSYDDRFLASAGNDRYLVIREFKNGKYQVSQKEILDKYYFSDLVFNPLNYDLLLGIHYSVKMMRLGKSGFAVTDSLPGENTVNLSINMSPTGDYAIFGSYRTPRIIKLAEGKLSDVETIYRHTDNVFGGSFSDDGKYMCTYGSDKDVIIWEIGGVAPSQKSVIAGCLDNKLTAAQKSILSPVILSKIIQRLDKKLLLPRDEFETSGQFTERRKTLADAVLSMLQEYTESEFGITPDNKPGKVRIPVQRIIGYNADLGIYKIAFLETEAGVKIPVESAKAFKLNWKKAAVIAEKKHAGSKKSFLYQNFSLTLNDETGPFDVVPVENPFQPDDGETTGQKRSDQKEASATEDFDISKSPVAKAVPEGTPISHALLFATDQYDGFSELTNPVFDATTIADELRESFGFDAELVVNPTLNQTIGKIREYAEKKYNQKDKLLILFAGHGMFDEVFKEGYIISRDSRADDMAKTSYLSHSNLRTMVNNIPCPHIFLIMDVCFGGTFDPLLASGHRGADLYANVSNDEFINRKMQYKTRIYLTSGGKEYVPDGRPGQHSPFCRKLLEALRNYGGADKILTISEILPFIDKIDPQPRMGEFGENEPGSDFIMLAK